MDINPQLQLAFDFLEYTGTSVFLTGKAGTGKTTFLRELRKRSPKRMVVLAPTGVAAINAGGATIHSFFQLPFGPYIPGQESFTNKFNKEKINIIRTMDLLVIDEISMVRADLLDAVSDMLKRYRDRTRPFGGVQLLLIGDLQQLAPVVREEEWQLLGKYYASPFFFCCRAWQEIPYVGIELTHVYRQSDEHFIGLLNKIRDNCADRATLETLNRRCIPGFRLDDAEGYITLTTHNHQAQQINNQKLQQLDTRPYTYRAETEGTFPEDACPTDRELLLKKGAQVMFVKNDSSPEKRYYNGKIGRITALSAENILVRCGDEREAISVGREEWQNVKYALNEETGEITETVTGAFRQYPLKTAWAITIHKSQGLTFEKAVIDAGSAFTHGQVYVALSRCKSLEGLVLSSPLRAEALINDRTVKQYTDEVSRHQPGQEHLDRARREYYLRLLCELVDYTPLLRRLQHVARLFGEHLWRLYPDLTARMRQEREYCHTHLAAVGERFKAQLERLVRECSDYEHDALLRERIAKGIAYFKDQTATRLLPLLNDTHPEIDNKEVRKTIEEALLRLQQETDLKTVLLESAASGFDIKTYLSVRAKAMIEKPKVRPKKTPAKTSTPDDIRHPRLYGALRAWRNEEAKRQGLPVYTILQQKALIGIANSLPASSKELLDIPGIGKKVAERYGAQLLEITDRFRFDAGSESSLP